MNGGDTLGRQRLLDQAEYHRRQVAIRIVEALSAAALLFVAVQLLGT